VGSVPVVFAIEFVVLAVVADQVAQGEAIVGSNEVDTGPGFPALVVEQLSRALQPARQQGPHAFVAPPIAPHLVPVAIVPFGRTGWMPAQLVPAGADIPG